MEGRQGERTFEERRGRKERRGGGGDRSLTESECSVKKEEYEVKLKGRNCCFYSEYLRKG